MRQGLSILLAIVALGGCGPVEQGAGSIVGKGDMSSTVVQRAMSIARETAAYLPQIVTTGCGVRATYIQMELAVEGIAAGSIAVDVCAGPKLRMPNGERYWGDHIAPMMLVSTPEGTQEVILDPVFDAQEGMTRQQWLDAMGAEPSQLNMHLLPNNVQAGELEGCGQLQAAEAARLATTSPWTYKDFTWLTYRVSHEIYWAKGQNTASPERFAQRLDLLREHSCRLLDRLEQMGLLEGAPARDDPAYVPCDLWIRWQP